MWINTLDDIAKVVEVFQCKERQCIVVKRVTPLHGVFHNGYVEVKSPEEENGTEETITWRGPFTNMVWLSNEEKKQFEGKIYIGFDTMHSWNVMNPDSQTKITVMKRCIKLAKELGDYDYKTT